MYVKWQKQVYLIILIRHSIAFPLIASQQSLPEGKYFRERAESSQMVNDNFSLFKS